MKTKTTPEIVNSHCAKLKEKAKWLQTWLHESPDGMAVSETSRASLGQLIAELQTLASGGSELRQKLGKQ